MILSLKGYIRYQKLKRRQTCKAHLSASCKSRESGCRIEAGAFSHSIQMPDENWEPVETSDFAAYSLAALSMSNGVEFTLESAVSAQAAQNISALSRAYDLWAISRLAPLRLNLPNIVATPENKDGRDAGIICLSGGIDSTYAALIGARSGEVSAGMLIAGADYKNAQTPAFVELQGRVGKVADVLGLGLRIVETDVRALNLDWELLHSLILASSLNFMANRYQKGFIGLDYAGYQELVSHPWGNNSVLPDYYSSDQFHIEGVGRHARRFDKLAEIAKHDADLPNLLSVCFSDASRGWNCGKCAKCVMTRVLYYALDIDDTKAFAQTANLADQLKSLPLPVKPAALKARYIRVSELVDVVPDGKIRDVLSKYRSALRKNFEIMALSA